MHASGRVPGTTVVVRPTGRLEGEHSRRFRQTLAALRGMEGVHVVVDLAAVPSLDDVAARALQSALSGVGAYDATVTLHHVRAQPREELTHVAAAGQDAAGPSLLTAC